VDEGKQSDKEGAGSIKCARAGELSEKEVALN